MNITVFICIALLLQGICFWIGSRSAREIASEKDYFLSGRRMKLFPLAMTLVATQLGGGTILGSAEEAYRIGWGVLFFPLGYALGFVVLSLGVGRRMAQFPVSTIAQLFEEVYGSVVLKKMASCLSIVSLFLVLVTQVIAIKKFMVGVGVTQETLFLLFWGIVVMYTVLGGFKAVVATDVVQAVFFIVAFFAALFFTLWKHPEAGTEVCKNLSLSRGEIPLFSWLTMPLLFMVLSQDMGQRCFSAESGRAITRAAAVAAVCMVCVSIVPIFFGLLGQRWGIAIEEGGSVLLSVIRATTSPSMTALVAAGLLAAIVSTADSLLNAIASNIAQDFSWGKGNTLLFSRWISFGLGWGALALSYLFTNILGLLVLSYEVSVSCLFIPVLFALFTKRERALPAILSMSCGGIGFLLFRWVAIPLPKELATLSLSALGYGIGVWLPVPKRQEEKRVRS